MSGKCKFSLAVILLFATLTASAEVVINEIMPSNISTHLNNSYNFTGWVEFYNSDSVDVNLKGYTIKNITGENFGNEKWSWQVPYDFTIKGHSYKLIYFDEIPPEAGQAPVSEHAPYKVDVDGGRLLLSDKDGNTINMVEYPAMYPHVSYGLYEGSENYMIPSPEKKNDECYSIADRCAIPTFDGTKPGIFTTGSKGSISLACATSGATIYYTTDGSEPTKDDKVYSKPIVFDTTICVRARAYKDGKIFSPIMTGSFIYPKQSDCAGGEKDAPIISITSDKDYFFGDKLGIYCVGTNGVTGEKSCVSGKANYNQDWARPINLEYFVNSKQVVSQEAEASIMGGCSRQWDLKSLKITTNKRTGNEYYYEVGKDKVGYPFFDADEAKKGNVYSSLQLRNGGNGAEGESRVKFRDGFMQSMAKQMGNIDYQAYQPVSFYLNGKYMGLMGLRERTNKSFIEANYGYDEDEIDVIEIVQAGYSATCGDTMAYSRMIQYASQHYNDEDFLVKLNDYMDVEEYINYMIFEQFVVNTDWPGNNCKLWRHRSDGKFRWISFDTDFGLGLYESGGENFCDPDADMINWCLGVGNTNWANRQKWTTLLFRSLMENEDFQQMLLTKYMMHLGTVFQEENIKSTWDSIIGEVGKEFCREFSKEYHKIKLEEVGKDELGFALKRSGVIYEQLAERYSLKNELVKMNLSCDKSSCGFYLNNAAIDKNQYSLKCLKGMKVDVKAKLPEGYVVKGWKVGEKEYTTETISVTMDETTDVVLVVEKCAISIPKIVINEICSKNTLWKDLSGSKPDWIELYNPGDTPVDVAGLYLSDNQKDLLMHRIPEGYSHSVIQPKGYLLIWADDVKDCNPMHAGFKLSDTSGETITLSKKVSEDSVVVIDKVSFGKIGENNSYGRESDGSSTFGIFEACQFGLGSTATPGSANGAFDCETIIKENTLSITFESNYAGGGWMINGKEIEGSSYAALKSESITLKPIYPEICHFDHWTVSREYAKSEAVLTNSSTWTYFYEDTVPAGEWMSVEYDDSDWSTGYGRFGYSTSSDSRSYNTSLDYGDVDSLKYITGYFRNQFDLDNYARMDSLLVTLTYDDAAIVYINGAEICRYNITSDSVDYSTLANTYIDETTVKFYIPKELLTEKDNVLAVEIHQSGSTSSDMTFSLDAETSYMTNEIDVEELTFVPKNDLKFTLNLIMDVEPSPSTISFVSNQDGCGVVVNGTALPSLKDTVDCMTGDKITLSPIIPKGFMFRSWVINGKEIFDLNTEYFQLKATTVKLNVEKVVLPSIVFNEISIANKSYKIDDNEISNWVEIYNNEGKSLSVNNIYISNSHSNLLLHKLEGILAENAYKLYWADGENKQSHLPFEIGVGDALYLTALIGGDEYLLDSVVCKDHVADGSYGRVLDADKNWTTFAICIDDITREATPGAKNGSVDCAEEVEKNKVTVTVIANVSDVTYNVNDSTVLAKSDTMQFITYKGKLVSIEPSKDRYEFSYWGESKLIGQYLDTISLFDEKTEWSIHYDSIAPMANWDTIGFDDSEWLKGHGKIGYGGDSYDTYLDYGSDSTKKYSKAYFRYEFDLENLDSVDYVGGTIMIDDGVAMYINGKEFVRVNLEKGKAYAKDAKEDEIISFAIDKADLKEGKNVIAVEIAQCSETSSDLTFAVNAKVHIRKDKYSDTIDENVPAVFTAQNDTTILLTMVETVSAELVKYESFATNIYPNPATDYVIIDIEDENEFNYVIMDLNGRIIREGYSLGNKTQVSLDNVSAGIYIIEIYGSRSKHQGKLIKE